MKEYTELFNPQFEDITTIVVHGGVFHADDVACVAMMKMLFPDINVVRTFKVPDTLEEGTIVVDMGGKYDGKIYFDHHNLEGQTEEESAVCSAELLWTKFGNPDVKEVGKLLREISLHDCGVKFTQIGFIIKDMNPTWDESSKEKEDEMFFKAVDIMKGIINRKYEIYYSMIRARAFYDESPTHNKTKILPMFFPWKNYAKEGGEIVRAIYPSRDGYALAIGEDAPLLPEEWLSNKPEGCTFVHAGRFISAFSTKEAAIEAALTL